MGRAKLAAKTLRKRCGIGITGAIYIVSLARPRKTRAQKEQDHSTVPAPFALYIYILYIYRKRETIHTSVKSGAFCLQFAAARGNKARKVREQLVYLQRTQQFCRVSSASLSLSLDCTFYGCFVPGAKTRAHSSIFYINLRFLRGRRLIAVDPFVSHLPRVSFPLFL